MTLSTGPWWWAPVFALGWMTTVPAQSFSAPARAWGMAAARFMPGVCAVLMSSSLAWTTRTPSNFHLGSCWLIGASGAAHYGAGARYGGLRHARRARCATGGGVDPLTAGNAAGHRACDDRCVSLTKGDMHEAWKTCRKSYRSSSDGCVWLCVRAEHVDVHHVLQLGQPGGSAERGAGLGYVHEEHRPERTVVGEAGAGLGYEQPRLLVLLQERRLGHAAIRLVVEHGLHGGPIPEQHRP